MEPKDMTIEELALTERKFLHDISNYLVVAQGMGSFLDKALKKNEHVGEKEKERMEKINNSVKKIVDAVKARRALLHSLSENEES
ncbi:MAG: hypothetical protein NXH75_15740 [Halobacteriovoraceae bacterium]|nr:hypothetical protein [Halobacteriovoraceae bacterium]